MHIRRHLPHAKRPCTKVYPGKYLGPLIGRFALIDLGGRLAGHGRQLPDALNCPRRPRAGASQSYSRTGGGDLTFLISMFGSVQTQVPY